MNDFEVSICGSVFYGYKSNQTITLPDSTMTNFKDSSLTNEAFIEMKLKRKLFAYKIMYEDYNFQATYEKISSLSCSFINELSLSKKIKQLLISGLLNYKNQIPCNSQCGYPTIYNVQNVKSNYTTQ